MKRLLWKEFHEHIWMFASAVAAPVLILIFVRVALRDESLWPTNVSSLFLAYVVFAFWGASRMPHERESSRLTLAALPVRLWQVWLLKALPGLIGAVVSACLVAVLGQGAAPPHGQQLSVGLMSGEMASAYCIAFLASLFWGVGASAVISGVASTWGWGWYWQSTSTPHQRTADVSWLLTATLLAVSACVMLARSQGASYRRAAIVTAAVCVTILGVALAPGWYSGRRGPVQYQTRIIAPPLVSREAGLIAYEPHSERIMVSRLDGSARREVAEGPGLVPLALSSNGEILFLACSGDEQVMRRQRSPEARRELARRVRIEVRLWDRRTGKSRVLETAPLTDPGIVGIGWSAAFVGGRSDAAILQPSGALGRSEKQDLWLLDTRTGKKRLLWPNISHNSVLWRDGWIELRDYGGDVRYVSPSGGRPREAKGIRTGGGNAL